MNPLYRLISLSVCAHMAFAGTRFIVLLYAVHLHASPMAVGTLAALYAVVPAFSSISVGRLVDRRGARMPMLLCSIALLIGPALAFAWRDLIALFIVSPLVGAAYNAYRIADQQAVGRFSKAENRSKNYTIYSLGISISTFLAPVLAGFSVDGLGHSNAFLLFALLPFAPLATIGLNKLRVPGPARHASAADANQKEGSVLDLLRLPRLRRVYFTNVILAAAWDVFMFLVPVYGSQLGLSATTIGIIAGAFSLATFIVRMFLPFLTRRFTPWQMLIIAQVAAGLGFLCFPAASTVAPLMALAFMLGLGLGITQPMSMTLLYEASPPNRVAEVIGLRSTLMTVGQTLLPLFSGALGSALGVTPVFWAIAALLLAGSWTAHRNKQ